jgi:hypothetical protein
VTVIARPILRPLAAVGIAGWDARLGGIEAVLELIEEAPEFQLDLEIGELIRSRTSPSR